MKNIDKGRYTSKMNNNNTKTSLEFLPSKVPSLGVYDFKIKRYKKFKALKIYLAYQNNFLVPYNS